MAVLNAHVRPDYGELEPQFGTCVVESRNNKVSPLALRGSDFFDAGIRARKVVSQTEGGPTLLSGKLHI